MVITINTITLNYHSTQITIQDIDINDTHDKLISGIKDGVLKVGYQ